MSTININHRSVILFYYLITKFSKVTVTSKPLRQFSSAICRRTNNMSVIWYRSLYFSLLLWPPSTCS